MTEGDRPRAGERVVLVAIPPGLLDGLPDEDQRAIVAIVGKPIQFVGYDDIGRAELEFDDPFDPRTERYSHTHTHTHTRSGSSPSSSIAIELPRRAPNSPGCD
jgi:hypothetical protein